MNYVIPCALDIVQKFVSDVLTKLAVIAISNIRNPSTRINK